MTGQRLVIGLVVMGIAVPAILFFFIPLRTPAQFFTVAVTCFLAWGIASFASDILGRPRLANRTPGSAFRDLEVSSSDEKEPRG